MLQTPTQPVNFGSVFFYIAVAFGGLVGLRIVHSTVKQLFMLMPIVSRLVYAGSSIAMAFFMCYVANNQAGSSDFELGVKWVVIVGAVGLAQAPLWLLAGGGQFASVVQRAAMILMFGSQLYVAFCLFDVQLQDLSVTSMYQSIGFACCYLIVSVTQLSIIHDSDTLLTPLDLDRFDQFKRPFFIIGMVVLNLASTGTVLYFLVSDSMQNLLQVPIPLGLFGVLLIQLQTLALYYRLTTKRVKPVPASVEIKLEVEEQVKKYSPDMQHQQPMPVVQSSAALSQSSPSMEIQDRPIDRSQSLKSEAALDGSKPITIIGNSRHEDSVSVFQTVTHSFMQQSEKSLYSEDELAPPVPVLPMQYKMETLQRKSEPIDLTIVSLKREELSDMSKTQESQSSGSPPMRQQLSPLQEQELKDQLIHAFKSSSQQQKPSEAQPKQPDVVPAKLLDVKPVVESPPVNAKVVEQSKDSLADIPIVVPRTSQLAKQEGKRMSQVILDKVGKFEEAAKKAPPLPARNLKKQSTLPIQAIQNIQAQVKGDTQVGSNSVLNKVQHPPVKPPLQYRTQSFTQAPQSKQLLFPTTLDVNKNKFEKIPEKMGTSPKAQRKTADLFGDDDDDSNGSDGDKNSDLLPDRDEEVVEIAIPVPTLTRTVPAQQMSMDKVQVVAKWLSSKSGINCTPDFLPDVEKFKSSKEYFDTILPLLRRCSEPLFSHLTLLILTKTLSGKPMTAYQRMVFAQTPNKLKPDDAGKYGDEKIIPEYRSLFKSAFPKDADQLLLWSDKLTQQADAEKLFEMLLFLKDHNK